MGAPAQVQVQAQEQAQEREQEQGMQTRLPGGATVAEVLAMEMQSEAHEEDEDDGMYARCTGVQDVVLVGEALVTHGDPVDALTRFLEV